MKNYQGINFDTINQTSKKPFYKRFRFYSTFQRILQVFVRIFSLLAICPIGLAHDSQLFNIISIYQLSDLIFALVLRTFLFEKCAHIGYLVYKQLLLTLNEMVRFVLCRTRLLQKCSCQLHLIIYIYIYIYIQTSEREKEPT